MNPAADRATVGIVANPLAGKDVRRLTSGATPVSDAVKIGVIRRAVVGAFEGGAQRVLISGDRARLGERALVGLAAADRAEVLQPFGWHTGRDSQLAAAHFRDLGVGAVIALGGDGTQRDVAKGWRGVPMVPLAVGTNNVFPSQMEATVAGFAAGAVASGIETVAKATSRAKIIDISLPAGRGPDVALVDVCMVRGSFVGARAVWESSSVSEIVAAIAEPASVGLSAIAAAVAPLGRHEAGGVRVRLGCAPQNGSKAHGALNPRSAGGASNAHRRIDAPSLQSAGGAPNAYRPGETASSQGAHSAQTSGLIRAAVMPGSYSDIRIEDFSRLSFGQAVTLTGAGVLTLDGEREIVLGHGEQAEIVVNADGPQVIDVGAAVAAAQQQRFAFRSTDR